MLRGNTTRDSFGLVMAIYYCTAKPLSRSSGRSAVSAAAYRAAERLTDERQGMIHNYAHRSGVLHCEIVLPAGVASALCADRNALWNAAEAAENRKDARTAREIVIALPHELDAGERIDLTRAFSQHLADQYGVAVDVAVHAPSQAGDERNHHAHLLMTTRRIGPDGLGEKSILEKQNAWLKTNGLPTTDQQIAMIRIRWEEVANEALMRAGHDIRIDARSHAECGLQLEPTTHMGVHATAIARRGGEADRRAIDPEASAKNARAVMARPAAVLDIITREKSVFDQRDIARALHRSITDPAAYQTALAKVMACPELLKLQDEYRGEDGRTIGAKFTTRALFATERDMVDRVDRMAQAKGFAVAADRAIARVEREKGFQFKDEQAAAVHHLAGNARVAAVAGMAGAGKSTMLGAANVAWTTGGHRVFGAALSGKAAEGLEESSSIKSYTLAKWEHQWKQGKLHLQQGDVFVIDEAGMVGSEQLARFVKAADEAGAKFVLVGDAEQLQAINAGAAFRAITDRVGCVDLE
ncbi:MAG TPA: Ti-type conjugative transfer relaxase TraA, partial [Rhodopila sp.]